MNDITSSPEATNPAPKAAKSNKAIWAFFLTILFLGSLAFFFVVPWINQVHVYQGENQNLSALQNEIDTLKNRVQALESHSNVVTAPPDLAVQEAPKTNIDQLNRIQNDMNALSSAMTALQTEMRATGDTATEARDISTVLVAAAISYIQLRDAANSGHVFTNELQSLRDAAKNDAALLTAATKLEPYASTGAPTLSMLSDELTKREPAIEIAVAKGSAEHWWQRILVALQSLITVRQTHSGASDALEQLHTSLSQDSHTAMEAFKRLPADAQQNLSDWQKQLELRQNLDEGLMALATAFTNRPVKTP